MIHATYNDVWFSGVWEVGWDSHKTAACLKMLLKPTHAVLFKIQTFTFFPNTTANWTRQIMLFSTPGFAGIWTEVNFKREFHWFSCLIQVFRCKLSHSVWFDVKEFIVEKITASDFFTVVLIGTRCQAYICLLSFICNVDSSKVMVDLKKTFWLVDNFA